jgi:hypothetical protein
MTTLNFQGQFRNAGNVLLRGLRYNLRVYVDQQLLVPGQEISIVELLPGASLPAVFAIDVTDLFTALAGTGAVLTAEVYLAQISSHTPSGAREVLARLFSDPIEVDAPSGSVGGQFTLTAAFDCSGCPVTGQFSTRLLHAEIFLPHPFGVEVSYCVTPEIMERGGLRVEIHGTGITAGVFDPNRPLTDELIPLPPGSSLGDCLTVTRPHSAECKFTGNFAVDGTTLGRSIGDIFLLVDGVEMDRIRGQCFD